MPTKNHTYFVYILCSKKLGSLYIGVTNDLARRIHEHKQKQIFGFSQKYHTTKLVYAETFQYIDKAVAREKQLKHWKRAWKIELIEKTNPGWHDLYLL